MASYPFIEKLASVFDRDINPEVGDFTIGKEDWDSLATIAAISLIHEECGNPVPLENLQACRSAREVLALLQFVQGKGDDSKP